MIRITHLRGRAAPAVLDFRALHVRIGSAPGNEIPLVGEPGVAPLHAEIRRENQAFWLVDLGSPGGTYVNRVRVVRHAIRSGDVVTFVGSGGPQLQVDLPGTLDAEGRVDLETAQRLVHAAVIQAASREDPTAAIIAAKVGAARQRGSRANALLTLGLFIALGATLVAAVMVYRSQQAAQLLAVETGIGNAPVARPQGSIPTRVYTGREIHEANRGALYVIGYLLPNNRIGGCCTGFAIKPDVIATNAHCVIAYRKAGGSPVVTQNDSGGKSRFKIVASQMHPGYKPDDQSADSPDVGLIRIAGRMPNTVTIASEAELRSLGAGDDVFVLGFPGRVMDPISPSLTFLQGHLGRTTGFDGQPTSPEKSMLLQHDAVTRGGNSGSPVFNQYGHVIAVHAAHLDDEADAQIDGQKTKIVGSSAFRIAMRVDLLQGVPAP
jgi:V8-like Glu-specific endopeptidase